MKTPLARSVFPPLNLTPQQVDEIEGKADALVEETLLSTTRFLDVEDGRVNLHAWKKLKHFDETGSITLYKERRTSSGVRVRTRRPTLSAATHHNRSSSRLYANPPPSFLVVGSLDCGLDDLMYGLSTTTAEAQRIRSSYAPDGIIDCQLLHQLETPSHQAPFNHLNLQWLLMGSGGVPFLQPRDYVVVDGAGVVANPTRPSRIGYMVRHSVALDGAGPVKHLKITRGALSICGIFHELSPSMVHVYMQMCFEPRAGGNLSKTLATSAAVHQTQALTKLLHCAQMKKLALAVRVREAQPHKNFSWTEDERDDPLALSYVTNTTSFASGTNRATKRKPGCGSCGRQAKSTATATETAKEASSSSSSSCVLCRQLLCRSCCIRKELSFAGRYNRIHQSKMAFCMGCISRAIHCEASIGAVEELTSSCRIH